MRAVGGLGSLVLVGVLLGSSSCGSTSKSSGSNGQGGSGAGGATTGGKSPGTAGSGAGVASGGTANEGGAEGPDGPQAGAGGATEGEPFETCEGVAQEASHLGCEFWPTLVANPVWSEFSAGVLLANAGSEPAHVEVTGPSGFAQSLEVPAVSSQVVSLPWVPELKGPEWSRATTAGARTAASSRVTAGAYKIVSSRPLAAWQFSPMELELPSEACGLAAGSTCRPGTGEASLLLPATSLTGNYRVLALATKNGGPEYGSTPGGFALTATVDGTKVQVQMPPHCGTQQTGTTALGACTAAGTGLASLSANEVYSVDMNAGDVLTLVGAASAASGLAHADVSGAIVNASRPVQVISFVATANVPDASVANSDHIEEVVPPFESFGKRYYVVPPSAVVGSVGHVVRIYGNENGTVLSYPNGKPEGAPDVINAGEVAQIPPLPSDATTCLDAPSHCLVSEAFTIEGSEPFGVASFLPGGTLLTPGSDQSTAQGDAAASWVQTPDQFRRSYVLYVPDTMVRFVDVLSPTGTTLFMDGVPVTGEVAFTLDGWQQRRVLASAGPHYLTADTKMSAQIVGYSYAAGYYYPAGGNFKRLSQPPVVIP